MRPSAARRRSRLTPRRRCPCHVCRVPHAAADELDELALEVTADAAAADAAGGDGGAGPTAEQRQQGEEAARKLLPLLEPLLERLLQRCQEK